MNSDSKKLSVELIHEKLPQTQCKNCGYEDCAGYAEAIFQGNANINRCWPGEQSTLTALAKLLNVDPPELDPKFSKSKWNTTAIIEESLCIGCTLCIAACPIDSIIGSAKTMHTVLNSSCSGCGLCAPPCPTDCIAIKDIETAIDEGYRSANIIANLTNAERSQLWLDRYNHRNIRLSEKSHPPKKPKKLKTLTDTQKKPRSQLIDEILAKAKKRLDEGH
ncbi:MAG: RnfABCDGE type electron transport complex subunit B [Burkholderiales bacterium]